MIHLIGNLNHILLICVSLTFLVSDDKNHSNKNSTSDRLSQKRTTATTLKQQSGSSLSPRAKELWRIANEYDSYRFSVLLGAKPSDSMNLDKIVDTMANIGKKEPEALVDLLCRHESMFARGLTERALLKCKEQAANAALYRLENWDRLEHVDERNLDFRRRFLITLVPKSPRSKKILLSFITERLVREYSPPRPYTEEELAALKRRGQKPGLSIQTYRETPISQYKNIAAIRVSPNSVVIVFKEMIELRLIAAEKLLVFYPNDEDVLSALILSLDDRTVNYTRPLIRMLKPVLKDKKQFAENVVTKARAQGYVLNNANSLDWDVKKIYKEE
jgi:hypothetical protein